MNVAVTSDLTTFLTPADEADLPAALTDQARDPETGQPAKLAALIARVTAEAQKVGSDTATEKGRAEIRSAAYKIGQSKTAIDKARKALTEGYREKVAAINAVGNTAVAQLQDLQTRVRAPLTTWEDAEKDRKAALQQRLDAITPPQNLVTMAAAEIAAEIAAVEAIDVADGSWAEVAEIAGHKRTETLVALRGAHAAAVRREADAAELAQLRAEAEERRKAEAEAEAARKADEARAAAERRQKEAEERAADEARARAERAAEEKIAAEKARAEAAERARVEAEQKAERDRVAAEERARADAERAERERVAAVEAERRRIEQEQAAKAEAERRRAESQRVRARARKAIIGALVEILPPENLAEGETSVAAMVADAIMAGEVPHVSFQP